MDKQLSLYAQHTQHNRSIISIHVDGAARGNPGPAGAGVHVVFPDGSTIKKGIFLGEKTNNQAEYLALALALFYVNASCREQNITQPHLSIFSDSELMIKQMRGEYKIKNEILVHLKKTIDTLVRHCVCRFTHILREKNSEADALANVGVDKKHKMPVAFIKLLSDNGLSI